MVPAAFLVLRISLLNVEIALRRELGLYASIARGTVEDAWSAAVSRSRFWGEIVPHLSCLCDRRRDQIALSNI